MRGALGSFMSPFITFGILLVYSVGPFVSYLALSMLGIGVLVLFMVLGLFLPESPVYLLTKSKRLITLAVPFTLVYIASRSASTIVKRK